MTDAAVKFAFFLAPIPAFGGLGWNIPVGLVVSLTIRCAAAFTAGLRFPRVEFRVMSVSCEKVTVLSKKVNGSLRNSKAPTSYKPTSYETTSALVPNRSIFHLPPH